ncbi:glycoside hydrolase family 10 protein [Archangium sp.]|uniref:glycoside hydrolase family 10 protein n=1 Tax=Archangium sp. TaxID=1872627 RepID=UPI002D31EC41|nr:family 10 glycosylhydrolase [Archangium sp.]HYO53899.1 family 10 glycosylhydrolase [Archangium sp.]
MRKNLLSLGLMLTLAACGTPPETNQPGASTDVDTVEPERVTVSHPRELRGVWVATVSRLDWPPSTTLTPEQGRQSLDTLVDELDKAGFNALFFQVRPESDALYASALEPWSRFLSGTQGTYPGWDPLEHLVKAAHARGLEVHAWMNPYRALTSPTVTAAPNHVTKTLAQHAVTYNNVVVMNPGEPAVRAHVVSVVKDLLDHYDVDGLHFDDYFYPYPDAQKTPFPDDATYARYLQAGGTLAKDDWRRHNVNSLVREVMELIVAEHPHVRFGVSPFGIWKNGVPVPGLDAYSVLSCDAVTWMQEGWVDYLAPQLYWRESSPQAYSKLATWWSERLVGGRHLFPGHAIHNLSSTQDWPLSEIRNQVNFTRTLRGRGAQGDIHFRKAFITSNTKGVLGLFRDELYARPALPPVLPRAGGAVAPPEPFVLLEGNTVHVTSPLPQSVRFFLSYRETQPGQWELMGVYGGTQVDLELTSGTWAISAVGRGGAESQGVRISVQ